jgi:hypothetical protein
MCMDGCLCEVYTTRSSRSMKYCNPHNVAGACVDGGFCLRDMVLCTCCLKVGALVFALFVCVTLMRVGRRFAHGRKQ